MKKLLPLALLLFGMAGPAASQAPNLINYQAIARDNGQLYSGTLDVKFTIRNGSCTGNVVFSEEHLGLSTNAYGLFNAKIGGGNLLSGSFTAINWNSGGAHFLEVELKFAGNSTYTALPCSPTADQFVSVPYALNGPQGPTGPAGPSGAPGVTGATGLTGNANIQGNPPYLLKARSSNVANSSVVYQDTLKNFIGIGNAGPQGLLHIGHPFNNDDVIFEGTGNIITGNNTRNYGKGTAKFIFNPEVGAFRLGVNTSANLWDGPLMAKASMAIGVDVEASGQGSVAFGASSRALAFGTLTLGSYLQADSMNSMVIGFGSSQGPKFLRNYRKHTIAIGASSTWPSIYVAVPVVPQWGRAANVSIGAVNIRKSIADLPRSTLEVAGSMALAVSNAGGTQADLTVGSDTISVVLVNVSGVYNVKLPKANTAPGRIYTIKRTIAGTGNITLQPSTGDTVEGIGTNFAVVTTGGRDCFTVISDGATGWWIINKF